MFKKEVKSRLLVTFAWLIVISLFTWRWYLPFFTVFFKMIWLWLGAVLGTFLLEIDHLLYTLLIHPQELTSQRVKRLIEQKRFKQALFLLAQTRKERIRLPLHNALFQVGFYGLIFFVLTSTGNLFGIGLVMSMALQFLRDEFSLIFKGREEYLRKKLFWPVKKEISFRVQKYFVILMLLVFVVLNLFLL